MVQRATVLAGLDSPGGVFSGGQYKWTAPDGSRRVVAAPRRELTGFEIVVASSNNNAVENITKELPGLGAIGGGWQAEAQYFGELATAFLGEPAWGMVAAPLGNAEKRGEFRNRFWWGNDRMHALLQTMERDHRCLRIGMRRKTVPQALAVTVALAAERPPRHCSATPPISDADVMVRPEEAQQRRNAQRPPNAAGGRASGALAVTAAEQRSAPGRRVRDGPAPVGCWTAQASDRPRAAWQQRRDELAAHSRTSPAGP